MGISRRDLLRGATGPLEGAHISSLVVHCRPEVLERVKDRIEAMPEALTSTQRVCASVNVASTRAGINMDASARFAELVKSPEYLHTYRITPLSIWNAAAAGR